MCENRFDLTVLGTRGSMAVSGPDFALFGGATSCYLVRAGEETIFLDGGSGLVGAPVALPRSPVILLSHLHLDHIMGLGMYARLSKPGLETEIAVPVPAGEDPAALLDTLYSPPFWPLSLTRYAGTVRVTPLSLPRTLGDVTVEGTSGRHPGGCEILRVSYRGRSLVYLTDYEPGEAPETDVEAFTKGADLLLYDGQYTAAESAGKKGFGHSSPEAGIRLMERCGVGQLLIVHHDPLSTDQELLRREAALGRADVRFARQGDVIPIGSEAVS